MEAVPYKAAAVRPPTTHHENNPRIDELDMQDTAGEVRTNSCDILLWTPSHGRAKAGRPARTNIQQLCADTCCNPEDLPEAMDNKEGWRERVRNIRIDDAT